MCIADIDIHETSRRPTKSGRQEIPVVIRNSRRAKVFALNGCLVVRKSKPKSKILGRIPLESDGVPERVFIVELQHIRRSRRILKNDWNTLQSAPSGPGDIAHDGKFTLKTLVQTEMINLRQIQLCGRALVEKDILERIGLREL